MRGFIHHLDLTVREPRDSCAFYDAVLGHMGYCRVREDERGFDWELHPPGGGVASAAFDPTGDIASVAAGGGSFENSIRIRGPFEPKLTSSPAESACRSIFRPPTNVPLRLPRSKSTQPAPSRRSSA